MQSFCIDVTVTSPNFVDMHMFDLWTQGYSISEASSVLAAMSITKEFGISNRLLTAHVQDHFTQFVLLETGLRQPDSFIQACAYHQLSQSTRQDLIHKYYSLDQLLLRELVCRKLSSKARRELSEIAERCDLRPHSCKRQFDNLLHVARRTEDLPGCLMDNIRTLFLLPQRLAECYAAVVFILTNRIEVSKKVLSYLTFNDLAYCTGQMMSYWSSCTKGDAILSADLDLQFFQDVKICKPLCDKRDLIEQHKNLVLQRLRDSGASGMCSTLDVDFKFISKAIVTIACGLTHAKEMRDFFLDIVEKIVEPMKNLGWLADDVRNFLEAYRSTADQLPLARLPRFTSIWKRFIVPFCNCIQRLYHT